MSHINNKRRTNTCTAKSNYMKQREDRYDFRNTILGAWIAEALKNPPDAAVDETVEHSDKAKRMIQIIISIPTRR